MGTRGTAQMSDSEIDDRLRGDIRQVEVQRDELHRLLSRTEEDLSELRELLKQVQIRRCRSIAGLNE
jgi:hypothetical protein